MIRREGVRDVDMSRRRRAEYSSDASNYRVVPSVVVFPRHVDEVIATVSAARRAGFPVTCRGGGTSIAGNSVGTRSRGRLLPPPRPRGLDRCRRPVSGRRAGDDPRHDHRRGRAVRAALRPGSVDSRARHPRRRVGQQLLWRTGAQVRSLGGQRDLRSISSPAAGTGSWSGRPGPGGLAGFGTIGVAARPDRGPPTAR